MDGNLFFYLIFFWGEEDKNAIFHIIYGMLTKSKFKDFFNKNVAML